jgi:YYY domain-containing protein
MVLLSVFLASRQREALRREWNQRWKYFAVVEVLSLAFFLAFLLVRLGNPDLWHPWYGGEKPMDFAYFNAVLRSTTFPPYDPWYAGGYLNYYYFGFVLVGMPVKLLGLVPSFAYNLILPSFFSMLAIGAFSIGYNLSIRKPRQEAVSANDPVEGENAASPEGIIPSSTVPHHPYWVGLAAALGVTVLGNLGTLRQILRALQQLGIQDGLTETTSFFSRIAGTIAGVAKLVGGEALPVALGHWYWIPSRAIPAPEDVEPITEFPMFTFLYADPHAHLWALPVTLLALAWALSVLRARGKWRGILAGGLGFFLGGLAIGALRPTNTWDIFVYLALGVVALLYTGLRWLNVDADTFKGTILQPLPENYKRGLLVAGEVLLLIVLSLMLYQPYAQWYALGYTKLRMWDGTNTPSGSYLVHWGVFLFVIVTWMVWETRQWMADTPLVSLRKLEKYRGLIIGGVVLILGWTVILIWMDAYIAWMVLPLAAWAGVLLLRPGLSDLKRGVLFMVGTGLVLTLVVELVVLVGDIGRMNTVFKFYLQVWTLFAVSAAAALGWLLEWLGSWKPGLRMVWQITLALLVFSALLFTGFASQAKMRDRMTFYDSFRLSGDTPPLTLDGMQYMKFIKYYEPGPNDTPGLDMDLSQDYRMIRWIQDNIQGSPVIVEAVSRNNYRWYSRVSIYTGLPAVVGWEWHQQQQRAVNPGEWVTERVFEVNEFYTTIDTTIFSQFLRQYDVSYIILGQLERTAYPGDGLEKFADFNGVLWREVYRDGENVIYQVIK